MFIGFEYADDGNYGIDRYFTIRAWRIEARFLVGSVPDQRRLVIYDRPKTALEQALDDRTVMLTDSMERELFAAEMARPNFFSLSEVVQGAKEALHLAAAAATVHAPDAD